MEPTSENPTNPTGPTYQVQQAVPNSTAVLVLGILSIVGCWCYGIVGLVLGIIALVLSSKDEKLLKLNQGMYTEGSVKNLKAGKICSIIGTSLSGLFVLILIIYFAIIGATLGTFLHAFPWDSLK
jgi:tetrahydromethanopterin S-methyltransferase subunit B